MSQVRPLLSPILVGRDDLLDLADRRISAVRAGQGHLLLLAGEAGIGKTRLLGALLRKARAAGFRIAKGDLAPADRQVPLASILDLARTMSEIAAFGDPAAGFRTAKGDLAPADRQGPLASVLDPARMVGDVAAFGDLGRELLELQVKQGGDTLGARRALVLDIATRIVASVDVPTVLAFEDLQWADEMSLEVIGELARLGRDRPLLLVAAYRADELPAGSLHREWRARLLTQRLAEEARLTPLTYEQTALVTTLILGGELPAPREVVTAIHERTDGIPLYIEELLGALDDEAPSDGRAIREAHVPSTIEDAILARFGRLSADARAVARAGAVIGRCFVPEVLAGIMDRPAADLDGPLDELVANAFLYPFEFVDHGYFDFRHQLLRDALYGTVPPMELRRLHARAGEFGAELVGASAIHASVHFERAGLRAQAYRAALAGAEAASAISSRHEAFELYARAVANAPDDLPAEELAALYRAYCSTACDIDNVAVADETARIARGHFQAAGRPIEAAAMLVDQAGMARRDVRPLRERMRLLDEAEAELRSLPASSARDEVMGGALALRSVLELDLGHMDTARAMLEESRRIAPGEENDLDVAFLAAELDVLGGDVERGLRAMLEIARTARDAGLESPGVTAYRSAAALAVRVIDYATAAIGLREGLRYADEIEQSYCRHVMAATAAHVAWAEGRWDEAIPRAAIELVEPGSRRGTLGSRDALGYVAFGRGQVDRARALLGESLAIGRESDEVELILPPTWGLAETALVAGEPDVAVTHCEAALELAIQANERPLLVPFVVTGVRANLAARRPEAAERWLEQMTAWLSGWEQLARPALDHAEGLMRTASGATMVARALLEEAIRGWEPKGRTWETAWARLDLAACLLRANRAGEALPVLRDIRSLAERLDSAPLLARADELRALARARGAEEEPWRPLTAREFEVARLVADGMTNAGIAEALNLSPRTVGAHIEHILAKLGATRRAEIAAWTAGVATGQAGATGAHR